jgi:hypothetical protein
MIKSAVQIIEKLWLTVCILLGKILASIVMSLVLVYPIGVCWNYGVCPAFGFSEVDFVQAFCIIFIIQVFIK